MITLNLGYLVARISERADDGDVRVNFQSGDNGLISAGVSTVEPKTHPRDSLDAIVEIVPFLLARTNLDQKQIQELRICTVGECMTGLREDGYPLAWDYPQSPAGYSESGISSLCTWNKTDPTILEAALVPEVRRRMVRWSQLGTFLACFLVGRTDRPVDLHQRGIVTVGDLWEPRAKQIGLEAHIRVTVDCSETLD